MMELFSVPGRSTCSSSVWHSRNGARLRKSIFVCGA